MPERYRDDSSHDTIVVLDFGSQTTQLIVRRVRELGVYGVLLPHDVPEQTVRAMAPRGLILSGSPARVYEGGAPLLPPWALELGVPILGICYGLQLLSQAMGGKVVAAEQSEYGAVTLEVLEPEHPLFLHTPPQQPVWMNHDDYVTTLPPGFRPLARTQSTPFAAAADDTRRLYGVQFHPEVIQTQYWREIFRNFLFAICGCSDTWKPERIVTQAVEQVRNQVRGGRAICALSGGVDSAVAALIAHAALGDHLTCVFVDNGLLRLNEAQQVAEMFGEHLRLPLITIDAADEFLSALDGIIDPEHKRRIIGEKFIRIFEREARRLGDVRYLVQGTLYPDVIESRAPDRPYGVTIKTHHNVGGLPADMDIEVVEPLRYLFKDEVRAVGRELGLPESWVWRHPFPGPGLAVRVLGPVTRQRLDILRAADAILLHELHAAGYDRQTQQAFAVLLPVQSVGVMGDGRTYADTIVIRAITTEDFMTADWARLPHDLLARISNRIVNEVPGVNRVVYDISSKPPATIEWE